MGTRAAGEVELVETSGTTGPCRKVEGEKEGEGRWKGGGDERVFIPSRPPGWKMGVSDAIPATAGGEGVTGPLDRMA